MYGRGEIVVRTGDLKNIVKRWKLKEQSYQNADICIGGNALTTSVFGIFTTTPKNPLRLE